MKYNPNTVLVIMFFSLFISTDFYCQSHKIAFEAKVSNFEDISPNIIRSYLGLDELEEEYLWGIGKIKLSPVKFSALRKNIEIDSIFIGEYIKHGPPYSATGPYYFFKYINEFYILTPKNYSKIYEPIETEFESILYLDGLLKLRGFRFLHSSVIYSKMFHFEHYNGPKFKFPISKSSKKNNFYDIRLITYDRFHTLAIYEQDFILDYSGKILKESEEKRIMTLGNGIVY